MLLWIASMVAMSSSAKQGCQERWSPACLRPPHCRLVALGWEPESPPASCRGVTNILLQWQLIRRGGDDRLLEGVWPLKSATVASDPISTIDLFTLLLLVVVVTGASVQPLRA